LDPAATIRIRHVHGNLTVRGWARPDLEATGKGVEIERAAGSVTVSGEGDLQVMAPRTARIKIADVAGQLEVQDAEGEVEVAGVADGIAVRNVAGQVSIRRGGDPESEGTGAGTAATDAPRTETDATHIDGIAEEPARAVLRAQVRLRQAERKVRDANRKLQQAFLVADASRQHGVPGLHSRPSGAGGASESATDDERLAILKMLHAGKITAEEAELLISALEGRAPEMPWHPPKSPREGS
jgi:hypothetical protein